MMFFRLMSALHPQLQKNRGPLLLLEQGVWLLLDGGNLLRFAHVHLFTTVAADNKSRERSAAELVDVAGKSVEIQRVIVTERHIGWSNDDRVCCGDRHLPGCSPP